jgi:predicted phosphodiesterase
MIVNSSILAPRSYGKTTDEELHRLYRVEGIPTAELAERFGLHPNGVRGRISRYETRMAELNEYTEPPFEVKSGKRPVNITLPRFTAPFKVTGDVIVASDIHVPTTDWGMVRLLCKFARKHLPKGQRVLMLVGDLINFDVISRFDHITAPVSLSDELATAHATMKYLLETFDTVYYTAGNHDHRLYKALKGGLGETEFGRLIGESDKLMVSSQTQAEVISGGQRWRLTHAEQYSSVRGRVASRLAAKYQCNIVCAHQHHLSMVRDDTGRYTAVDGGGLFDYSRIGYVGNTDTTGPVMCGGFVFIQKGTAHLLTPYPTITDWSKWGLTEEGAVVVAAERERHAAMYGGA